MPLLLAIDQSTSATKAILFDEEGRAVDREAREHAQHYPQPGWVEHDAEEIWQNVLAVLLALVARHASRRREIYALSITNQRETVVVFDRASGRPLRRALVWQDRRGDALCAEHAAAGGEGLVGGKTGLKIDGYFSAPKLQWLVRHEPGLHVPAMSECSPLGAVLAGQLGLGLHRSLTRFSPSRMRRRFTGRARVPFGLKQRMKAGSVPWRAFSIPQPRPGQRAPDVGG